jgi:hypothetical protein
MQEVLSAGEWCSEVLSSGAVQAPELRVPRKTHSEEAICVGFEEFSAA